jgi:TolB protein
MWGGLAVVSMAVVLCLAAVAGIGGLLWLRSAQPAIVLPAPAAPVSDPAPDAPATAALSEDPEAAQVVKTPVLANDGAVNRIAFVDPAGRLGTVAPDGSDSRLLTGAGAAYQFPAWAPDSGRIAAVGVDGSEGGVYVWNDEENARRDDLFTSSMRPPIYLYWSPDSRQVSFLANDRSSLGLWLAEAGGAKPARQIASGQPFYWNWSQSSDQLFIHSGGLGRRARLAFLDTNGERTGQNVASPGLFQAPGISVDGRYLAYGESAGERFVVAVEDQNSGERTTVPHLGQAALGWSPTTQQLAWTSPRQDQLTSAGPLRLLDATTGEIVTLVQDTVFAFFWSPDGRSLAYLTLGGSAGNPGAARPAGMAALSAAGQTQRGRLSLRLWVVDVASGQQRLLSTFRPSEIFLSQFLPFFDQYALSHRLWSPASDAVVLPMVGTEGASGIYVVSVASGEATRVAEGTMAFWSWR